MVRCADGSLDTGIAKDVARHCQQHNNGTASRYTRTRLPVGLMQTWASVDKGYWFARSPEFLHTEVMQTLRWLRVPGDTIFALGAIALVWFAAGLKTGHSLKGGISEHSQASAPKPISQPN